jgi:uncharacterized protein YbjT (DUF2867 family)
MSISRMTVLAVGATGSIGRLVVDEALRHGHSVRALLRNPGRIDRLPRDVQVIIGDVTQPDTLSGVVDGADAVVLTLGSDGAGRAGAESVDYGGVRNILAALGSRTARIVLMTSIGVTNRTGAYNRATGAHDWKRRSERLVRASGLPYTIVRPGWFDCNGPNERRPVLLQGDKRQSGTPRDGGIARHQIAGILVRSLSSDQALRKTFELIATAGPVPDGFDALFASLDVDPEGALDGVHDMANMPLEDEPQRVRDDMNAMRARKAVRRLE